MSPVFSWLSPWRAEQLCGTLAAIFVADIAGAPMRRVDRVRALAGAGLEGDRYALGTGHWVRTDGCQLTLVVEEELRQAERRGGLSFAEGQHRRNLVVRGIPAAAYRGRRVRIGDVLLEFQRLRPPCGYLDRIMGKGTAKALGKGAGIGLKVVDGGWLEEGAPVTVLEDRAGKD